MGAGPQHQEDSSLEHQNVTTGWLCCFQSGEGAERAELSGKRAAQGEGQA